MAISNLGKASTLKNRPGSDRGVAVKCVATERERSNSRSDILLDLGCGGDLWARTAQNHGLSLLE